MLLGDIIKEREAELSPMLREFSAWVAAVPAHTAESLLDTWCQRDILRGKILRQMRDSPVLICPVASVPAFRHGERSWEIEEKTVRYLEAWSYCEWFNLLGMPAAVEPMGKSSEGLPIGIQIAGRPWEEERVLSIAEELEAQTGGWQKPLLS